jgi:hypothetical protein
MKKVEFCRLFYFNFFNSILTKNLETVSSFFRIFYFKIFKIHWMVYEKPVGQFLRFLTGFSIHGSSTQGGQRLGFHSER